MHAPNSNQAILWFKDLSLDDRPLAGGKGASLGTLTRAGLPVPAGFVISARAFMDWLDRLDAEHRIRKRIAALKSARYEEIKRETEAIRSVILTAPLDSALQEVLPASCLQLGDDIPVAVRSSATSEDSAEASFAGLQDTYLWVSGAQAVQDAVRRCWASLYSIESVSYRLRLDIQEEQLAMAVVVQAMVRSRTSGVMFTRSPHSGDRSVITIEASWGLGSSIVSGEVTPDRFVVNKVTGELRDRVIANKALEHVPAPDGGTMTLEITDARATSCCLSDEEIGELCSLATRIEKHYGCPQDIEWAIDQQGRVLLLQSRPETVWAARDSAPVAKPEARAFDHIFNVLGGRKKS